MELRHLRYFVAVAEELSFSRAAERLHVSQPPLSQQIKQLEEEVTVQLLERTKRWVRLTSAGRLFLEHARQVLAQVDSAVLAARRTMGGEGDRLAVACTPWADLMAVPRILQCFSEVHRRIGIEIQTLDAALQLRAVKAGTVDVGFMLAPPEGHGLQIERLVRYQLVVALPAHHRLATLPELSPRDLAQDRYVMLTADVAPAYGEIVAEYWRQAGVPMSNRLKADQPHAVIDLVAAGAGFALVPSSVQEYRKELIAYRRLIPVPPDLELSLVWARGVESPAVNALREVARRVVAQPRPHVYGESGTDSPSGGLSDRPSGWLPATPLGRRRHGPEPTTAEVIRPLRVDSRR